MDYFNPLTTKESKVVVRAGQVCARLKHVSQGLCPLLNHTAQPDGGYSTLGTTVEA